MAEENYIFNSCDGSQGTIIYSRGHRREIREIGVMGPSPTPQTIKIDDPKAGVVGCFYFVGTTSDPGQPYEVSGEFDTCDECTFNDAKNSFQTNENVLDTFNKSRAQIQELIQSKVGGPA